MVGLSTLRSFKMIIRQNIIQNFPFTIKDIEIAGKIFGTDVSTLNLITTIQSSKVVVGGFIEIPR